MKNRECGILTVEWKGNGLRNSFPTQIKAFKSIYSCFQCPQARPASISWEVSTKRESCSDQMWMRAVVVQCSNIMIQFRMMGATAYETRMRVRTCLRFSWLDRMRPASSGSCLPHKGLNESRREPQKLWAKYTLPSYNCILQGILWL